MAQIVTITNPLTGQPAQVDQLDHTAQQIDDAIARALPGGAIDLALSTKPNQNLLDNWYFGNPVNQRGQTSYTGAVPCFDRWLTAAGISTVLIKDGYIELYGYLVQKFDVSYYNYPLTFSILYEDGTFASTSDFNNKYAYCGYCQVQYETNSNALWIESPAYAVKIKAAKLELGTQQTLAHQDSSGNWQLNELPNYAEQLARCQRYYLPLTISRAAGTWTGGTTAVVTFPLPAPMRTTPAIGVSALGVCCTNTTLIQHTAITVMGMSNNMLSLALTMPSDAASGSYLIELADAQVTLSAEL